MYIVLFRVKIVCIFICVRHIRKQICFCIFSITVLCDNNNTVNWWQPGGQRFSGSSTGLMAGFGAEYRMTQNLAITADYDYFGKRSKLAWGGMLSVGL